MHDHPGSWCSGKAAQMGITEAALNIALHAIDVKKESVLYLLPKKSPDATDFSKSRFDPALESSEYLQQLFSDVNNMGHKRAGIASLYIRGTRSKSGVKSLPTPLIIYDELDEMHQRNLSQAKERMSGSEIKKEIKFSTPTIPDFGIDAEMKSSNEDHYFFPCPLCGKQIELVFPDDLIITGQSLNDPDLKRSYIKCNKCGRPLPHEAKKFWLKPATWENVHDRQSETRGFYINQLYSLTINPYEIAQIGIKAPDDPSLEQEYYNSKGGLAHVPEGSRIAKEQLDNCRGSHSLKDAAPNTSSLITMGIDQGKKIYYEIDEWYLTTTPGADINSMAVPKVLRSGWVSSFEELHAFMFEFQVKMCVMDINPERRKAEEFAKRFYGFVKLCYYNRGISGKSINEYADNTTIAVDRSSWLDVALGRFRTKKIVLPRDIPADYKDHIHALIRRYEQDPDGNPIIKYLNIGADHLGHARTYAEIALPIALAHQVSSPIASFL